jgi:hypothetical protein
LSWDKRSQFERGTILFPKYYNFNQKLKNGLLKWQNAWVEAYLLKKKLKTLIKTKFGGVLSRDPCISQCNQHLQLTTNSNFAS